MLLANINLVLITDDCVAGFWAATLFAAVVFLFRKLLERFELRASCHLQIFEKGLIGVLLFVVLLPVDGAWIGDILLSLWLTGLGITHIHRYLNVMGRI
jgi:hypothetical protein